MFKKGWILSNNERGDIVIKKDDYSDRFKSDDEATEFVVKSYFKLVKACRKLIKNSQYMREEYLDMNTAVDLAERIIYETKIGKQEVIYIDGYYLDNNSKFESSFENYKCIIGEWDGVEDDNDIFYYFENEEELKHFQRKIGRTDTEFVVTKVERS